MRTKLVASAVVVVALSGCVMPPQPSWVKSNVSPNDSETALAQCKYQVGMNKVDATTAPDLIKECMEGKGFRWEVRNQ